MDDKEKFINELEDLRKNFGLTEEEINGLIEFYEENPKKIKRVINLPEKEEL